MNAVLMFGEHSLSSLLYYIDTLLKLFVAEERYVEEFVCHCESGPLT